ncbi:MAG: SAM-dependent chlorinase/fluorinase, partial [Rhodospirillales bacterium]
MDVRVFRMIVTFTDFGIEGPYLGQMRASLTRLAPGVPIIDLMVDVPAFDVQAAAYLLPAVMKPLAADTVCLAVVDPGVGGDRLPVILRA